MAKPKITDADRIRQRREDLGMSRRELATATGLPTSKIWTGEHQPIDDASRKRIVVALNSRAALIAKLPPLSE